MVSVGKTVPTFRRRLKQTAKNLSLPSSFNNITTHISSLLLNSRTTKNGVLLVIFFPRTHRRRCTTTSTKHVSGKYTTSVLFFLQSFSLIPTISPRFIVLDFFDGRTVQKSTCLLLYVFDAMLCSILHASQGSRW